MKNIMLNGVNVQLEDEKNLINVAKENGVEIPCLCFLEECGNTGKCGVCLVEVEGQAELLKACEVKIEDGMVINTNTEAVQEGVKATVSSLLDKHEFKCGPCSRKENCEFLKLVIKTKARASKPFVVADKTEYVDDRSKAIVLDRTKCVKCGRCVAACKANTKTESIKFVELNGETVIGPEGLKCFDETNCLLCGQCVAVCPVAALTEKSHVERVKEALADENKHVIVAMAPAVRTSMGELFKMGYGADVTGKVYTALRQLGFNKIFDINFGADMTIMEEATELIERIKVGGPFPMFTSCCPGWVRHAENYFPELLNNLSSAKSPQQMFGAASKSYYPAVEGLKPEDIFTVTIMPCTAKKFEADRPEMENDDTRNIDAVLTVRELAKLIKEAKIDLSKLEDSEVDPAMGEYTGAGTIFGATGGVMEAALRTAKDFVEGADLDKVDYEEVRGLAGIKEATVEIGGQNYNVAVVNGASNLFDFVNSGRMKEKDYHFIEVMACNGGCVNGGGQPHVSPAERAKNNIKAVRASVLYNQDKNLAKRKSHDNVSLKKMYETYKCEPGHGKAHELFHLKYKK